MAAESFCRVGVIGTDGEDMGTADEGEDSGCFDEGGGGKILQNFPRALKLEVREIQQTR